MTKRSVNFGRGRGSSLRAGDFERTLAWVKNGRRKVRMMEADQEMVQRVANILGPMCAAQNALDKAAEYMAKGWTVKYWFSDDNHIVVEGIDPEKMKVSNAAGESK